MFGIVCAHKLLTNAHTFQMTRDRGTICPEFCCGSPETFVEKRQLSGMVVQCAKNCSRNGPEPNPPNWHTLEVEKKVEEHSRLRNLGRLPYFDSPAIICAL